MKKSTEVLEEENAGMTGLAWTRDSCLPWWAESKYAPG